MSYSRTQYSASTQVKLIIVHRPVVPRSQVKHSTTEPKHRSWSKPFDIVFEIIFWKSYKATNLAFHSNETSKDWLSIILNWLSSIVIQVHLNYTKMWSLHWNIKEIVVKFVRKKTRLWCKTHLLKRYVLATHWNCLYEAIPMCTYNIMLMKIRKTIWFTLTQYCVHCLCVFLNIPNCQLVLKYLLLYGKLFIFVWQLYLLIWVHELPLC